MEANTKCSGWGNDWVSQLSLNNHRLPVTECSGWWLSYLDDFQTCISLLQCFPYLMHILRNIPWTFSLLKVPLVTWHLGICSLCGLGCQLILAVARLRMAVLPHKNMGGTLINPSVRVLKRPTASLPVSWKKKKRYNFNMKKGICIHLLCELTGMYPCQHCQLY